jgi:hypothetical protein
MGRGLRFATWISGVILLSACSVVLIRGQRIRCLTGELPTRGDVQADPHLSKLARLLPATARDIRYFVRPFGGVVYADFTIDKDEFIAWNTAQGWSPLRIKTSHYLEASPLNAEMVSVDRGFFYEEKHSRDNNPEVLSSELRVVFDEEKSLCYYRFTD